MNSKPAVLAVSFACAIVAAPAFAKGGHKEKYYDGDCKVERKWKKDGRYEEKRKCSPAPYAEMEPQSSAPVVITLPPVVILPGGY